MARAIGVEFSIGASMQRTVASAFTTVGNRVKGLRADLKTLEAQSAKATRLVAAQDNLAAVKERMSAVAEPSEEMAAALRTAQTELRRAERAAAKYNITAADASRMQAKLTAEVTRTGHALARQERLQANAEKRKELKGKVLETVAVGMSVLAPVKLAVDYESAMADVRKVTDFDDAGFKKFSGEILDLSETIPMSAKGLSEIAAAAGQAGIAKEELVRFTSDAAKMGIAFDISAQEAGSAMTGLRTNFKLNQDQVVALGDSFNYLANNMDAKAGDIVNYANRVGGTASLYKFTGQEVGALGATFLAAKVGAEEASTATSAMLTRLGTADKLPKDAQKAFKALGLTGKEVAFMLQKDGQAGLIAFLRQVKASKDPMRQLSAIFGMEHAPKIAKLMNSLDLYEEALRNATDREKYAGSMEKEYATRSETTANALQLAANRASRLGITLGSVALPAIVRVLDAVGPYVTALSRFAEQHETATAVVFGTVGALAAIKVAALIGGYGVTVVSDAWTKGKAAVDFFRRGVGGSNRELARHRGAASRATDASRGTVGPLNRSARAFRAQARAARTSSSALRRVGGAWKVALGPIGIVLSALELLYNGFDWVKRGVDAFIAVLSDIPVVGPAFRAVAGALGFGPDTEEEAAEAEARARKTKETIGTRLTSEKETERPDYLSGVPNPLAAPEGEKAAGEAPKAVAEPAKAKGFAWDANVKSHDDVDIDALLDVDYETAPPETVAKPPKAKAVEKGGPVAVASASAGPAPRTGAAPEERGAARRDEGPSAVMERNRTNKAERQAAAQTPLSIQLTQEITFNGVSDKDFARRVIEGLSERRGDFERLISSIVNDQRRLSYGR